MKLSSAFGLGLRGFKTVKDKNNRIMNKCYQTVKYFYLLPAYPCTVQYVFKSHVQAFDSDCIDSF